MASAAAKNPTPHCKGPPKVSRATEGVRFFLACQVVFNHVGLQAPGSGSSMEISEESWGAFGQARFMCIHVPAFFALAGFSLASSMGPSPRSKLGFIAARLLPMYPLYLFSLLLLLVNTVVMCNPAVFDDTFHWLAQWDDANRGDFCEPAPLLSGYWGSLFATIIIYALGLQAWPVVLCGWFLSYYTWFSSVYYGMLFSYPCLYSLMISVRGRAGPIWAITGVLVALNCCVVAGWVLGWLYQGSYDVDELGARDRTADSLSGQWALLYYLFPPFWWPTFALGVCAAFLFDMTRPYEKHSAWVWGVVTDLGSLLLVVVGYVVYPLTASCLQKEGLLCPSVEPDPTHARVDNVGIEHAVGVGETDAYGTRLLAGISSRLVTPLVVLWLS